MRVIPAMKIGMDDYDILVEKLGRKKKQVKEIEERMIGLLRSRLSPLSWVRSH
jgi:hypothetical protein